MPTPAYYEHPVFDPLRLHLHTPAMTRLADEAHRWLWTGITGGLIYGAARTGKTTAVDGLAAQLHTRGNVKIPVYRISVPRRDQSTVMSIYRHLCWSVHLRESPRDRADHLSERLIHYIADRAVEAECQQAVLVVDEMQRLHVEQFDAFAELYDNLKRFENPPVLLTTLFVGNDPECWDLVEHIQQPRYSHIRGRFFTQGIEFLGLTSIKEVEHCLAQYDTLRYPADGPTYTENFLPDAFIKGWRLASWSSDIWRVFRSYQQSYHIRSWGMQYFTTAINALLTDYLPRSGVEQFSDEIMHACIALSELVPSLVRPKK